MNRYIVRESASIKVCECQVMVSNGLFEETNEQRIFYKYFTINYILNFLYVICDKNPSMKNFSLQELNNKTKSKNTMISRVRLIAHVNLLACVPTRALAITRVSGNSEFMETSAPQLNELRHAVSFSYVC